EIVLIVGADAANVGLARNLDTQAHPVVVTRVLDSSDRAGPHRTGACHKNRGERVTSRMCGFYRCSSAMASKTVLSTQYPVLSDLATSLMTRWKRVHASDPLGTGYWVLIELQFVPAKFFGGSDHDR